MILFWNVKVTGDGEQRRVDLYDEMVARWMCLIPVLWVGWEGPSLFCSSLLLSFSPSPRRFVPGSMVRVGVNGWEISPLLDESWFGLEVFRPLKDWAGVVCVRVRERVRKRRDRWRPNAPSLDCVDGVPGVSVCCCLGRRIRV